MQNHLFTDVNSGYPLNRKPDLVYNADAVNEHIGNLLSMSVGEYWWEPTCGANLVRYVYEPLDAITANRIYIDVISTIPVWIPYIRLISGTQVIPNYDNNSFDITIKWQILGSNVSGALTASLERK